MCLCCQYGLAVCTITATASNSATPWPSPPKMPTSLSVLCFVFHRLLPGRTWARSMQSVGSSPEKWSEIILCRANEWHRPMENSFQRPALDQVMEYTSDYSTIVLNTCGGRQCSSSSWIWVARSKRMRQIRFRNICKDLSHRRQLGNKEKFHFILFQVAKPSSFCLESLPKADNLCSDSSSLSWTTRFTLSVDKWSTRHKVRSSFTGKLSPHLMESNLLLGNFFKHLENCLFICSSSNIKVLDHAKKRKKTWCYLCVSNDFCVLKKCWFGSHFKDSR